MNLNKVVSFRAPKSVVVQMNADLKRMPQFGQAPNANKWARKLFLDWVAGRLFYKDAKDRFLDPVTDENGRKIKSNGS
jgi:hypothetical protein